MYNCVQTNLVLCAVKRERIVAGMVRSLAMPGMARLVPLYIDRRAISISKWLHPRHSESREMSAKARRGWASKNRLAGGA